MWGWLIGSSSTRSCGCARMTSRARAVRRRPSRTSGRTCIGYVGEVFDAEEPFAPGGCVAQAWGVAELLRCLLRVQGSIAPGA